jgi:cytochrome c oxidase subunit 2
VRADQARRACLGTAALLFLGLAPLEVSGEDQPRRLRIVAHKFEYEPHEIRLKKGEPVTLEFTSLDVTMGFNSMDFNLRIDIVPGRIATLTFTPDKSGEFVFFCDVFCGNGHEEMEGRLVVSE